MSFPDPYYDKSWRIIDNIINYMEVNNVVSNRKIFNILEIKQEIARIKQVSERKYEISNIFYYIEHTLKFSKDITLKIASLTK